MLLPRAAEPHGEDILRRIQARIDLHNLGRATVADKSVSLEDVYKQADASMYRSKLFHRGSHDRQQAEVPTCLEGAEGIRKKPSQP